MGTPLYNTDIIPLTSRPTLTVMDDGDYFVILDTSTGKISKILKTNIMTALKISYDNTTSELTAETVQAALDELVVNLGSSDSAILALSGRLDTLEGTGAGSVAKAIDDAVSPLAEVVDNNRLYSDSQYLALKAKADSLQVKCNTLQAEVYTDDPILQYGAVEIIGDGYEADNTPIDVSANVVDGSLEMEQKGLTITNLIKNGDFSSGLIAPWSYNFLASAPIITNKICSFTASAQFGRIQQIVAGLYKTGNVIFVAGLVKADSNLVKLDSAGLGLGIAIAHSGSGNWELLYGLYTATANTDATVRVIDTRTSGWTQVQSTKIITIDITALGLSTITDTAILAKLLPYVDGTKSVGKMGMRVVGRNLFDKTKVKFGGYFSATNTVTLSSNSFYYDEFIDVKPSTIYAITNFETIIQVVEFDKNKTFISRTQNSSLIKSFTTLSKTRYIKVSYFDTDFDNIDLVQLNYGSSTLPYEPYQEQLTFLPAIGNSLPNGTADSIKTVADGWEHSKRVYTPEAVGSGVAVNRTNYPTAKNGGQWVNELTAGGTEIGVVGTDSTTGAGMLRFELATPIVTKYDLPHLTSGKTIHRFAGEEKIALYGTGLTFSENVLSVLSAVKFVAGVMTDITDLATITDDTVTFSGVNATDVVYVKVEHDVDRPLGILKHTPAVSNTASRLASLEARVSALEV